MPEQTQFTLKLCPFCGGEARCYKIEPGWWWCECANYDGCHVGPRASGDTPEEAQQNWNQRTKGK
jgi:ssDNA-binding Zn-finger/Zn-ribbon topoisomerase 1